MTESWSDLARQLIWEMNPQDNWHGGNAIFKEFDDKYIGTGEGNKAHGWGHYSADNKNIGARYVVQRGKPITFNAVPSDKVVDIQKLFLSGEDLKPKSEYLYRVNVPNENFMLDAKLPLEQQPIYIQNRIRNLANELPSKKFYINSPEDWLRNLSWEDNGMDFYKTLSDILGAQEKKPDGSYGIGTDKIHRHGLKRASKMLNKYGIYGIRSYGRSDGPINVVFRDKNIKMANTPMQRFVNRIPTQTLGKMATKILQSPVVKVGGKILEGGAIPLTVLDMLKLQGAYPYSQKEYKQMLNDMGIQYSNGQFQL